MRRIRLVLYINTDFGPKAGNLGWFSIRIDTNVNKIKKKNTKESTILDSTRQIFFQTLLLSSQTGLRPIQFLSDPVSDFLKPCI